MKLILDCYTDEAAGLGVPPYLGTYPRYIAGYLESEGEEWVYATIDDLRQYHALRKGVKGDPKKPPVSRKTDIYRYNLTGFSDFDNAEEIIVNLGVHVPGKYLSAVPGTLNEAKKLLTPFDCKKTFTGPVFFGTQLHGGGKSEKVDVDVKQFNFSFEKLKEYSVLGAKIIDHIPWETMIEIETGRGCRVKGCSFCTEPLKSKLQFRKKENIFEEIKELKRLGCENFRIGKQACFYSHPESLGMIKEIKQKFKPKILHIDNVNPNMVLTTKGQQITEEIAKYGSPGNVAAFGVESFDPVVCESNNLNSRPEKAYEAIRIVNKYGAKRGSNGMPAYLPGINIIFGLIDESKKTHEHNFSWLKKLLDEKLMLRRINIRQATVMPGTMLAEKAGTKFLNKNKKFYWKWRNEIRQKIDLPMLDLVVPKGTMLKDVRAEIWDGKTTFGRQMGTYPLVVGIPGRLEIGKSFDIVVKKHSLRSVTGELA